MKTSTIVGYRKFLSRDKKTPCCIVTVFSDYSDRELQYGAVGKKSEEIWVPKDFQDEITPNVIGKDLNVSYYRNGNNFFVDSIEIV